MKFILSALSILTLTAGLAIICVGAFFLKRLDDHAFGGDPAVFYGAAHHYGSITLKGSIVCLIGCIGLALALDHTKVFTATTFPGYLLDGCRSRISRLPSIADE
jgi:hypothetical protein